MKKLLFALFLMPILSFAQVGINTSNPQTTFHLDGRKDNPVTGTPSATQQINDFSVTSSGNVGIGTVSPTERLDVTSGNVRVRDINSNIGDGSERVVVADTNGVLKMGGGEGFSTSNSGNRFLEASGGSNWVYGTNWFNRSVYSLPLQKNYDPYNAYNASTGEYTIPKDGLYYIAGNVRLVPGAGTFNGTSGILYTAFSLSGVNVNNILAANSTRVFSGANIPEGSNDYNSFTHATVWLKAGQKVTFVFYTYGSNSMASDPNTLVIQRTNSLFRINKLL